MRSTVVASVLIAFASAVPLNIDTGGITATDFSGSTWNTDSPHDNEITIPIASDNDIDNSGNKLEESDNAIIPIANGNKFIKNGNKVKGSGNRIPIIKSGNKFKESGNAVIPIANNNRFIKNGNKFKESGNRVPITKSGNKFKVPIASYNRIPIIKGGNEDGHKDSSNPYPYPPRCSYGVCEHGYEPDYQYEDKNVRSRVSRRNFDGDRHLKSEGITPIKVSHNILHLVGHIGEPVLSSDASEGRDIVYRLEDSDWEALAVGKLRGEDGGGDHEHNEAYYNVERI